MNICAALWSLKSSYTHFGLTTYGFQRISIRIWTHPTLDVLPGFTTEISSSRGGDTIEQLQEAGCFPDIAEIM